MAEYIERERVKELLKSHYFPTDQPYEKDRQWAVGFNAGLDKAIHKIHYAPAADVVPVVHGHWITGLDNWTVCSECKALGSPQWKGCPMCLARMDGAEC